MRQTLTEESGLAADALEPIKVKGKGELHMYFVTGQKAEE